MEYAPIVSVICPLFNKSEYICQTIDSVIRQSYSNWEMILVDDGSTDGSFELAQKYARDFENIFLFRRSDYKEVKGGSICRNIGLQVCRGLYVVFLDADDMFSPNCLSDRMAICRSHPDRSIYIFNHCSFREDIGPIAGNWLERIINRSRFFFSRDKKQHFLKRFLKYDLPWTISNVLWERRTLKSVGGFDESFCRLQDPQLHTSALLKEDVTLKCVMYHSRPDVWIRVDEGRHKGLTKSKKYLIHIDSVTRYIDKFTTELRDKGKLSMIRYLEGYVFSLSTNINYLTTNSKERAQLYAKVQEIIVECDITPSRWFKAMLRLHNSAHITTVLKRMGIPGLIYKLYMWNR